MFASRGCSVFGRAIALQARCPMRSVVPRAAFAAEPLQPSIQLSPALRLLKTSMTPLERLESWEVVHQRAKREKELAVESQRERVEQPHWSSWYQQCLATRPILTKVRPVRPARCRRLCLRIQAVQQAFQRSGAFCCVATAER